MEKGVESDQVLHRAVNGQEGSKQKLETSLEAMTEDEDCPVAGRALEVRQKDGVDVGRERKQRIRDTCRTSGFTSWLCIVALIENKMAGGEEWFGSQKLDSFFL